MRRRVLRKRRSAQHKYIGSLPVLPIRIDHRNIWRFPHDRTPLDMSRLVTPCVVVFQTRKRTDFPGSHRPSHFNRLRSYELYHFPLVLSPVKGHAEKCVAVMIFVSRVKIQVIAFVSDVVTFKGDSANTVVIMKRRLFPVRTPSGFY